MRRRARCGSRSPLTGGGAGEEQVGHVGAGDEENKENRGQNHEQCRTRVPHQILMKRNNPGAAIRIGTGIFFFEADRDRRWPPRSPAEE